MNRASYEEARLALARLTLAQGQNEREVLRQATRTSARALGIERVGVWFFEPDGRSLRCEVLYCTHEDRHEEGSTIPHKVAPAYFAELRKRRVIAVEDALRDPATRELATAYLIPRSIASMLDAPLYCDGEVVGVVCHEHVGDQRAWALKEVDFVGSVADIISNLFLERRMRALEEQVATHSAILQDAAELATLTAVTRAYAHDINNALTVAMMVGNRLAQASSSELAEMGTDLTQASEFAARLVRQLRRFADRETTSPVPVGEVFEALAPVLQALVRGRCRLRLEVRDPDLVPRVTRTQLEQVLFNLCINARDASADGGEIHVLASRDASDRCELVVRDDGAGIPPDLVPHVFTPYVTTKPEGSGLGLPIVKSIVEECGGQVELHTELGRGTTVTVRIPLDGPRSP